MSHSTCLVVQWVVGCRQEENENVVYCYKVLVIVILATIFYKSEVDTQIYSNELKWGMNQQPTYKILMCVQLLSMWTSASLQTKTRHLTGGGVFMHLPIFFPALFVNIKLL
jgi:hypothetical protein